MRPPAIRNDPIETPNSARISWPISAATSSVASTAAAVIAAILRRSALLRSAVTERKIAMLPRGLRIANLRNSLDIDSGSWRDMGDVS
jgi:hypothetical protein